VNKKDRDPWEYPEEPSTGKWLDFGVTMLILLLALGLCYYLLHI
jgi:hypothetical protein